MVGCTTFMKVAGPTKLLVLLTFIFALPPSWAAKTSPVPVWRSRGAIISYCASALVGAAITIIPALKNLPTAATRATLAVIDLDHDGHLSDIEMNGIANPPLVEILQRVSPKDQIRTIKALSNSKLAWLLLESPNPEWKNQWLLPIAENDPKRVAKMMLTLREPETNMRTHVELELLEGLPTAVQTGVMNEWKLLDDNSSLPSPEDSKTIGVSEDDKSAPKVPQNGYIFTTAAKNIRAQTSGAGPCVVVTLWDAKTKSGLLVHMHAKSAAEVAFDFDRMLTEFEVRGIALTDLEVGMVGGWKGLSDDLVWNIRNRLLAAEIPAANFKYVNTLQRNEGNVDVELDLRNGSVSIYTEGAPLSRKAYTKELEDSWYRLGTPVARHPKSL